MRTRPPILEPRFDPRPVVGVHPVLLSLVPDHVPGAAASAGRAAQLADPGPKSLELGDALGLAGDLRRQGRVPGPGKPATWRRPDCGKAPVHAGHDRPPDRA